MKIWQPVLVTVVWLIQMAAVGIHPTGLLLVPFSLYATYKIYKDSFREDFPNGWNDILIDPAMLLLLLPQRKK